MAQLPPVKFLPVGTSSQHRADRIHPSVWDHHKAGIIREYQQGGKYGIARASKWIEGQKLPFFKPSRQQVARQIKVLWKVEAFLEPVLTEAGQTAKVQDGRASEHRKETHSNDCSASRCTGKEIFANTLPPPKINVSGKRMMDVLEEAGRPSTKKVKKGSVPDSRVDIHGFEAHTVPGNNTALHSQQQARPPFRVAVEGTFYPQTEETGPPTTTESETSDCTNWLDPIVEAAYASSSSEEDISDSDNEDMSRQGQLRVTLDDLNTMRVLLEALREAHMDWLISHVLHLLDSPSKTSTPAWYLVQKAADFFFYNSERRLAFPLYLALWHSKSLHQDIEDVDILAHGICAAFSASHLEVIKDIVKKEILETDEFWRRRRLRVLLLVTNIQLRDFDKCYQQLQSLAPMGGTLLDSSNWDFSIVPPRVEQGSLGGMIRYYISSIILNFMVGSNALKAFTPCQAKPSLGSGLDGRTKYRHEFEIISYLSSIDRLPGHEWIRDYLNQCHRMLRIVNWLPPSWNVIMQHSVDKLWTESTCLSWLLWEAWQSARADTIGLPSREQDVFATQVLSVIAFMILAESPKTERSPRPDRIFIRKDHELLERANNGLAFVSNLTDDKLSQLYLHHFITLCVSGLRETRRDIIHLAANGFMSGLRGNKVYEVFLPTADKENSINSSQLAGKRDSGTATYLTSIAENPRAEPHPLGRVDGIFEGSRVVSVSTGAPASSSIWLRPPSLDLTMASSLSSSTLSSMARTGRSGLLGRLASRYTRRPSSGESALDWRQSTVTIDQLSDRLSFHTIDENEPSERDSVAVDQALAQSDWSSVL